MDNISRASRVILPLSTGVPILPGASTKVVNTSKGAPLTLDRLMISNGGTAGGAGDWIVNDIEVDGVSQLSVKDLPGALFSTRGIVAEGKRAMSSIHFSGLDVIERHSAVVLTVTYIGLNESGCPFFGSIVGGPPPQRPTVLPIATKRKLLPTVMTKITSVLDQPLEINTLEIEDVGTRGGAADWIVNDIRIDGASQFKQSGDVPGDLFSTRTIDTFVKFLPGTRIELIVTYIGLERDGCCFTSRILGTVVRENRDQPPPDVHATIRTGDDAPEELIARCNWRPPYVPEA